MHLKRVDFAAAACAFTTIGIPRYPAGAAEFTYKVSIDVPESYPASIRLKEAAEKTLRDTNGRLELKNFYNSQLGGEADILSQIRLGAVELTIMPDNVGSSAVPAAGVTTVPFLAANLKEVLSMLTGGFAAYVRGEFAKLNVYQFPGTWDSGGFRNIMNSVRPLTTPTDVRAMKIRVSQSPEEVAAVKAIGGTPVAMAQIDAYPNMQTHLLDGIIVGPAGALALKYYEVTKYLSVLNWGCGTWSILGSATAWNHLPKNIQDTLSRNIEAARIANNADMLPAPAAAVEKLKGFGMIANTADWPSFQKSIRDAGLYAQWKAQYGQTAWSLLEKSVGRSLA